MLDCPYAVTLSQEGVIKAIKRATGSELSSVELDRRWSFSEQLWTAVSTWEVAVFDAVEGLVVRASAHPDNDDEMDDVRCSGWIKFAKRGRAGLIFQHSGGEAI